jgi:hypothetical protein
MLNCSAESERSSDPNRSRAGSVWDRSAAAIPCLLSAIGALEMSGAISFEPIHPIPGA